MIKKIKIFFVSFFYFNIIISCLGAEIDQFSEGEIFSPENENPSCIIDFPDLIDLDEEHFRASIASCLVNFPGLIDRNEETFRAPIVLPVKKPDKAVKGEFMLAFGEWSEIPSMLTVDEIVGKVEKRGQSLLIWTIDIQKCVAKSHAMEVLFNVDSGGFTLMFFRQLKQLKPNLQREVFILEGTAYSIRQALLSKRKKRAFIR
ncbi:MAG: hypothetical protein EBT45_06370 [Alphaproteobacteria bacterium]|nr:hypothetical protein [Alphaproteobacteria bacterium]